MNQSYPYRLILVVLVLLSTLHQSSSDNLPPDTVNALTQLINTCGLQSLYPNQTTLCGVSSFIVCNIQLTAVTDLRFIGNGEILPDVFRSITPTSVYFENVFVPDTFFKDLNTSINLACINCNITTFPTNVILRTRNLYLRNNPIEGNYTIDYHLASMNSIDLSLTDLSLVRPRSFNISDPRASQLLTVYLYTDTYFNISNSAITSLTIQVGSGWTQEDFSLTASFFNESNIYSVAFEDIFAAENKTQFAFPNISDWVNPVLLSFDRIDFDDFTSPMEISNLTKLTSFLLTNSPRVTENIYPLVLPPYLSTITIQNCSISSFPDFNGPFGNVTYLYLNYNKINQPLPKLPSNHNISSLDISNNQITGSVDPSFCKFYPVFYNNQLSGVLPQCFMCHLSDPRVQAWVKQNQFSNYQDGQIVPQCNAISVNMPVNYTEGEYSIPLSGSNLGWFYDKIESNVGIVGNAQNIHNIEFSIGLSTSGAAQLWQDGYTNVTFKSNYNQVIRVNINRRLPYVQFMSSRFYSNLGYSFYFYGYGFTRPLQSVKYGTYPCGLQSQTDNSFTCVVYNTQIPEGLYTVDITLYNGVVIHFDHQFVRSYPVITAMSSPPNVGGNVTVYGEFGFNYTNTDLRIGNISVPVLSINSTIIIASVGPGSGTKNTTLFVNGMRYYRSNLFVYADNTIQCPNQCSDQGSCVNGYCFCLPGWKGRDCSSQGDNSTVVNPGGLGTQLQNSGIVFGFKLSQIQEIDLNGDLTQSISFSDQQSWILAKSSDQFSNQWKFSYNHPTSTGSTIHVTQIINEFKQPTNITFSGISLNMDVGSIKLSINITSWEYRSSLNNLFVVLESYVESDSTCSTNINSESDSGTDSLRYLMIERDGKTFYGRFIDKVLSDGRPTYSQTSIIRQPTSNSVLIGIGLPHCKSCIIDPDFSMLVTESTECPISKSKWLIPTVSVICVVVGLSLIIGLVLFLRKNVIIRISIQNGLLCLKKSKRDSSSQMKKRNQKE